MLSTEGSVWVTELWARVEWGAHHDLVTLGEPLGRREKISGGEAAYGAPAKGITHPGGYVPAQSKTTIRC